MVKVASNISDTFNNTLNLTQKLKQIQIYVVQQVGAEYPNVGTLPIQIHDLTDMCIYGRENMLKSRTVLNDYSNCVIGNLSTTPVNGIWR